MSSFLRTLPFIALTAATALTACDGKDADTSGAEPLTPTASIGAEGGSIAAEGGAQVDVPADALADEVELTIEQAESPEDFGATALSEGFDAVTTVMVTPHGTTFSTPATLSLPYSAAELGDAEDELVLMRIDDPSDTSWEPQVGLELDGGVASAEIDGFSVYSLAAVAAGACPCWSGADLRKWRAQAITDSLQLNYGYSGGTYESFSCAIGTRSSTKATWTINRYKTGGTTCRRADSVGKYGGAAGSALTGTAQFDACLALMVAPCQRRATQGQLAAYATDLPTGESVTITVSGTSNARPVSIDVKLEAALDLVWASRLFDVGTAYSAAVKTQPASTTCSIAAPTGKVAEGNGAVEVGCVPVAAGGCTVEFTKKGETSPTISESGTCLLGGGGSTVQFIAFQMGSMHLIDDGFDLEEVASWETYVDGGGEALVILSMEGLSYDGGKAVLEDYSGINGHGFGSSTIKNRSTITLAKVEQTAKTFSLSVEVDVLDHTTNYPPKAGTDTRADFGNEIPEDTIEGELLISGEYE